MSTDRDLLPLHERQAARTAIEKIVQQKGSQAAAGEVLGVSQNAINKAMLYTKVGPSVMRLLLTHLGIDVAELLRRYGDPSYAAASTGEAPKAAMTPKEEAIVTAVRFAPGASEAEIRELADEYETLLKDAPPIEWLETLLREVQRRILIPQRQERGVARKTRSAQRTLRKLHDAAHAEPAVASAANAAKVPSAR